MAIEKDHDATITRDAMERRTLARLEVRNRLLKLAAEATEKPEGDRELERLRAYLLEWAAGQGKFSAGPGHAKSQLADYARSSRVYASDWLEDSDGWAMAIIDTAVGDLAKKDDGVAMQAALRLRYLQEGITNEKGLRIRVFRSGRLQNVSMEDADRLADRAENALLPMVKVKGLPL
jgi:hypothetical protein